jgi:hypothetical protein
MKMKAANGERRKQENNILRDEWRGVEGMAKHQKKFRLL